MRGNIKAVIAMAAAAAASAIQVSEDAMEQTVDERMAHSKNTLLRALGKKTKREKKMKGLDDTKENNSIIDEMKISNSERGNKHGHRTKKNVHTKEAEKGTTITTTSSTANVEEVEIMAAMPEAIVSTAAPEAADAGYPNCPAAYDYTKTTYTAGEMAEVKEHIFQCKEEEGYVKYCNICCWDDLLLKQNENAKEMWNDAWMYVGPCTHTSEVEATEEEVVLEEENVIIEMAPPALVTTAVATTAVVTTSMTPATPEPTPSPISSPTMPTESPAPPDGSSIGCVTEMCSYILSPSSLLKYQVNMRAGSITMEIIHDGDMPVWLGLAFSQSGGMVGSDAVIGIPGDNTVQKYNLEGKHLGAIKPMDSNSQTLTDASIEVDDYGQTIMKFTKLLAEDNVGISLSGITNIMLFAHGNGDGFGYHGGDRMAFEISF